MNIALPGVQVLRHVYRPAFELTLGFLPYELGIIKSVVLDSAATLKYRRQNNPGGLLKVRGKGESISKKSAGLSYYDEDIDSYGFADGRETLAADIVGLQDPNNIDPRAALGIAAVMQSHMDELMTVTSNTMRLWASLPFVPNITIDGVQFNNNKLTSLDISGSASWANTGTDILGYLTGLKKDWFGSNKGSSNITVLHRASQTRNICRNTSVIKAVMANDANGAELPTEVPYRKAQLAFASFGIYFHEWEDYYYSQNDSEAYENSQPFLNIDYVSVIPRAYFQRTPGVLNQLETITPQSSAAPFIEVVSVPEPEFAMKPKTRGIISAGNLNGAYSYSGFPDRGPERPYSFESYVAARMALFVEDSLRIRYIKVS